MRTIYIFICGVLILSLSAGFLFYTNHLNTPPEGFPVKRDIVIPEGVSVQKAGELLYEENVIRSPLFFRFTFKRDDETASIQAGIYQFPSPFTTTDVLDALIQGDYISPHLRFTLPEGYKAEDLYTYTPKTLLRNKKIDLRTYEGYLFPDTYYVPQDITTETLVQKLTETFEEKTRVYKESGSSTLTFDEAIILASIIEREAKDTESKKRVSGILQNRLQIEMPLQVDAVFDYLYGVESSEVRAQHLDSDSPYNTYKYRGLPPRPIANPGIESIDAVYNPTPSDHLYYLTGNDGVFYYAKTFEEHKRNKERYLR